MQDEGRPMGPGEAVGAGFSRIETVSRDGCRRTAHALREKGTGWHIHSLAPDCRFNPRPGLYAFVVEDEATGTGHMSFDRIHPRSLNIELLKHLHGDAVLEPADPADVSDDASRAMLDDIARLKADGASWHHHVIAPRCRLNPEPGRWAIALEAPGLPLFRSLSFDEEPAALIAAIERLYFLD